MGFGMYDLQNLNLFHVFQLGNKLKEAAYGKHCLEDVAQELVCILYEELVAGNKQDKACALVRYFKTHRFNDLEPGQKEVALQLLPADSIEPSPELKCLTLVATVGDRPEWNSRTASQGHQAIPLPSEEILQSFPMISGLLTELGVDAQRVISPDMELIGDDLDKTYGVFFVPNPVGSPLIPAQEQFVIPFGIQSVLGFGGLLPDGEVFAIILFLKIPVGRKVADRFRLLSLYTKIASFPFYTPVFKSQIDKTMQKTPPDPVQEKEFFKLRAQALESVIRTHEQLVGDAMQKLAAEAEFRKKLNEELENANREKGLILEAAGEGIYGLDLNGLTTFTNPAADQILGYESGEILGKPQHDVIHHSKPDGSTYPRETCPIYAAFRDGHIHHETEEVFWRKDGTSFPVEYISRPIIEEGTIKGAVVTFKDISERKQAEENFRRVQQQLLASQKLASIGQLSAGVSHEVLNPLNIISLNTQMLARKRKDDSDLQVFAQKIMHEVVRIEKITHSLLVFSREGDSRMVPVPLNELVQGVIDLVEHDFLLDNIKVERACSTENLVIQGDLDKLRQVFLNLVYNARYAMPKGGTLSFGCRPLQKDGVEWVEVQVADTGIGISKEHQEKIFVPFFTTKPEGEGTGMGLALAHGIVLEHGGTIRVESEEGRGTRFIIEFPRVL